MRIGVDARPLISESPSGIGIYLLEVLKNIKQTDRHEYVLYSNEPIRNKEPLLKQFEQHVVKGKIGTFSVCFGLKKQLIKDKIDVFWGTEHMLPLNCKSVKKVLTIHDLALMINPSWGSKKNAIMQNIFCRLSCKCADRIIAISEATKSDLIRILKIKEGTITAIPNGGYTDVNLPEEIILDIERRIGISGKPFFAYTGNIEPRKNILGIIKAFELLNEKSDGEYYLVLAGKMGWKVKPIKAAISASKYKERIIMPGYISENEKKYLMNHAIAFVFPSNYEGFGIPVIEAFSCGGIVITAKNSSLPEVGGSAAFYVSEADNVNELGKLMQDCASLTERERSNRIAQGREHSKQFTWKECAIKTQAVLET